MNQSDKNILQTVDEVVDDIIEDLTLAEKVGTADLNEDEFRVLELTLGKYIQHKLDQVDIGVNKKLMEDCIERSEKSLDEIDAATVVALVVRLIAPSVIEDGWRPIVAQSTTRRCVHNSMLVHVQGGVLPWGGAHVHNSMLVHIRGGVQLRHSAQRKAEDKQAARD